MGILSRRNFATGIGLISISAGAAPARCEVCGRRLQGKSWIYAGKSCCSPACVDQLRPTCAVCGTIIRGSYRQADGKIYCSETCFGSTLNPCEICKKPIHQGFTIAQHHYCESCVKNNPTCFSCGLPAAYPTRLKDGREICNTCMRWSVKDQNMAQKHYDRARRNLEAWTSLKIATVPELVLVDRTEIQQLSNQLRKTDSPVSVRGLYSRQITITTHFLAWGRQKKEKDEQEKIYLVDHLHDEVFRTAAMHELMHDLIHEHFQRLKNAPLWVHEGICQRAAAEYCQRRNYADILHGIQNCDDPDYGDGYRYFDSLTGFQGWHALKQWMETVNVADLPKKAPK